MCGEWRGGGTWVRGGKKKGKKNLKNGGKSNKKVKGGGEAREKTFRSQERAKMKGIKSIRLKEIQKNIL